ncbi:MAG: hypothetical protein ACOVQE_11440 [Chitinophagaceae bacterium]
MKTNLVSILKVIVFVFPLYSFSTKDLLKSNIYVSINQKPKKDSVYIVGKSSGYKTGYTQNEYNQIRKYFISLFATDVKGPAECYESYFKLNEAETNKIASVKFGGDDNYYVLYAHFLKQQQTSNNLNQYRWHLLNGLSALNNLYAGMARGGSFFSHLQIQTDATVEFALNKRFKNVAYPSATAKTADFLKEKEAFKTLLKQKIQEKKLDKDFWFGFSKKQKNDIINDWNKYLQTIDKQIVSQEVLHEVKAFHAKFLQ